MQSKRMFFVICLCLILATITGCAKDLSTGRSFTEFQTPPEGKAVVYLVRNDNFMAGKPPYMFISAAGVPTSTTEAPPKEKFSPVAIVGKEMFVPILAMPGDYYFKNALASDRVSLKSGEVVCVDVGSKFRGITLFLAERIESLDECRKLLLAGQTEGVQMLEARRRLGWKAAQSVPPEKAQAQIVLNSIMVPTLDQPQAESAR